MSKIIFCEYVTMGKCLYFVNNRCKILYNYWYNKSLIIEQFIDYSNTACTNLILTTMPYFKRYYSICVWGNEKLVRSHVFSRYQSQNLNPGILSCSPQNLCSYLMCILPLKHKHSVKSPGDFFLQYCTEKRAEKIHWVLDDITANVLHDDIW